MIHRISSSSSLQGNTGVAKYSGISPSQDRRNFANDKVNLVGKDSQSKPLLNVDSSLRSADQNLKRFDDLASKIHQIPPGAQRNSAIANLAAVLPELPPDKILPRLNSLIGPIAQMPRGAERNRTRRNQFDAIGELPPHIYYNNQSHLTPLLESISIELHRDEGATLKQAKQLAKL
jgi:hypothetical protein